MGQSRQYTPLPSPSMPHPPIQKYNGSNYGFQSFTPINTTYMPSSMQGSRGALGADSFNTTHHFYSSPHSTVGYAHGGKVLAHFNTTELDDIEDLLGHRHTASDGVRDLSDLDHILSHPSVRHHLTSIMYHKRARRAMGGSIDDMADQGRFGDNAVAYITPQTQQTLDSIVGQSTQNPNTGQPEYFSLSGALSGLKSGLGKLGTMASSGLSKIGTAASNFAAKNPNMMKGLKDVAGNMGQNLLQGGMQGLQNWSMGGNFADSMKQGLKGGLTGGFNQMANTESNPAWMQALGQAGNMGMNAYENRNTPDPRSFQERVSEGLQNHLPDVMNRGMDFLQQRGMMPEWAQQGASMGRDFVNQGLSSGDWGGASRQFAGNAFDQGMDRARQYAPSQYGNMMQGLSNMGRAGITGQGDWRQGASQAFGGGLNAMNENIPEWARQPMQDTFNEGLNGGDWGGAARRGIGRAAQNYEDQYMPYPQAPRSYGRPQPSYGYGYAG